MVYGAKIIVDVRHSIEVALAVPGRQRQKSLRLVWNAFTSAPHHWRRRSVSRATNPEACIEWIRLKVRTTAFVKLLS